MREYVGGMADWLDHGGAVESAAPGGRVDDKVKKAAISITLPSPARKKNGTGPGRTESNWTDRVVDALVLDRTIGGLLGIWLAVVVGFGLIYWIQDMAGEGWLRGNSGPLGGSLADLATAVYFSFVTALTIGYGDIVPVGPARVLAIIEGAAGLLVFGFVISKLVSRRQEELTEDTHRIAFEQRLGRVRTSLHLVLSELQTIATMCGDDSVSAERVRIRAESTIAIFEGELRTVHDLLYRPEQMPDEQVLESILASLAASLEVLGELLGCMPAESRGSPVFHNSLGQVRLRAIEICADCVPREYAPHLAAWMNRVQQLASPLA